MKIVADAHIPFIKDYFGHEHALILKPGRAIQAADVKDADMLIVRSITPVNAQLLEGTSVKFVGSVTAGTDHLDTHWLDQQGIFWCTASGFNAPPVADYVISTIAAMQKKRFLSESFKSAVIGVGHVGKLVVERLNGLSAGVTICDPIRAMQESNFHSVPLDEIADCDFISIHVPLTRHGDYPTYHFIDSAFLKRQKAGCVLLNASRGGVIDSNALLQHGQHLHACLDVFEHEPNISKPLLTQAALATPHIAGYSVQSKMRGIDLIYQKACEKNLIKRSAHPSVLMPIQHLAFAGDEHRWQDIVLGIFNPMVITEMMRTILLPVEEHGLLFDEMRNQFNYRYEFGFTTIRNTNVNTRDQLFLEKLGIKI